MSLWAVFVLNCRQVFKEWRTSDWLMAEMIVELFPSLKKRLQNERRVLARRDTVEIRDLLQSSASTERR